MASAKPQRRGGKKNRKHKRNFRWGGEYHSVTKYRAKHGIPAGPRKRG